MSNLIGHLQGTISSSDSEEGTTYRCPASQGIGHLYIVPCLSGHSVVIVIQYYFGLWCLYQDIITNKDEQELEFEDNVSGKLFSMYV